MDFTKYTQTKSTKDSKVAPTTKHHKKVVAPKQHKPKVVVVEKDPTLLPDTKIIIRSKVVSVIDLPTTACLVYAGRVSERKEAIKNYKRKFGVWPTVMYYLVTGEKQWWAEAPKEEHVYSK